MLLIFQCRFHPLNISWCAPEISLHFSISAFLFLLGSVGFGIRLVYILQWLRQQWATDAWSFFRACGKASAQVASLPLSAFLPCSCHFPVPLFLCLCVSSVTAFFYNIVEELDIYCPSIFAADNSNIKQKKNDVEWKCLNAWTKCMF